MASRLRVPRAEERFFTARLGSWANRHRWLVLGAVAAMTLLAVALLGGLGTNTVYAHQSGPLPCLRCGRLSRFDLSTSSDRTSILRVSRGSMTSST